MYRCCVNLVSCIISLLISLFSKKLLTLWRDSIPTLDWVGKSKVINHHQEVPFRVLENQYTYGADDSENMIIHGDNLEALKALLPRYEGIYIEAKLRFLIQDNLPCAGLKSA